MEGTAWLTLDRSGDFAFETVVGARIERPQTPCKPLLGDPAYKFFLQPEEEEVGLLSPTTEEDIKPAVQPGKFFWK